VEANQRPVAEAVAVRAHRRKPTRVTGEGVAAVRHAQAEQLRRRHGAGCRARLKCDGQEQKEDETQTHDHGLFLRLRIPYKPFIANSP
jgi:hypothetical protein